MNFCHILECSTVDVPSLLESTNTMCWFLGFSAESVKCKHAFSFSIFYTINTQYTQCNVTSSMHHKQTNTCTKIIIIMQSV